MRDPNDIEIKVDIKLKWSLPAANSIEGARRSQKQIAANSTAEKVKQLLECLIDIRECV